MQQTSEYCTALRRTDVRRDAFAAASARAAASTMRCTSVPPCGRIKESDIEFSILPEHRHALLELRRARRRHALLGDGAQAERRSERVADAGAHELLGRNVHVFGPLAQQRVAQLPAVRATRGR